MQSINFCKTLPKRRFWKISTRKMISLFMSGILILLAFFLVQGSAIGLKASYRLLLKHQAQKLEETLQQLSMKHPELNDLLRLSAEENHYATLYQKRKEPLDALFEYHPIQPLNLSLALKGFAESCQSGIWITEIEWSVANHVMVLTGKVSLPLGFQSVGDPYKNLNRWRESLKTSPTLKAFTPETPDILNSTQPLSFSIRLREKTP